MSGLLDLLSNEDASVKPGRIVLLNGASSAGKTTTARALQQMLETPWLRTGIDQFWSMIDERWIEMGARAHEGILWRFVEEGEAPPTVRITLGPWGKRLVAGMHHAVAALARAGNNLVVDDVLVDPTWLVGWLDAQEGLSVLFVGLRCPLEVLEQRERIRGSRRTGEARGQFQIVHSHCLYDLEIDTSRADPSRCAQLIRDRLYRGPAPEAFDLLRVRMRHSGS